jgi:hypothetical protein
MHYEICLCVRKSTVSCNFLISLSATCSAAQLSIFFRIGLEAAHSEYALISHYDGITSYAINITKMTLRAAENMSDGPTKL